MVAQPLGLGGQVVGVDADAVAADQSRRERQEIPLGRGCRQHVGGADAETVADQGELVHQRDVEIALGVLEHLRGLGHPDRRRPMQPRGDDRAVHRLDARERPLAVRRDHLGDRLQPVRRVARIDALRRVAEVEVAARPQAGGLRQPGAADLLGQPREHRALEHHQAVWPQGRPDLGTGSPQGLQVGLPVGVDRRGHGHQETGAPFEVARVTGEAQVESAQLLTRKLAGGIVTSPQRGNADRVDVEADHARMRARHAHRHGQTDIAQPHDGDLLDHERAPSFKVPISMISLILSVACPGDRSRRGGR